MDDNKVKIDLSVTDETDGQPKKNKQARDWCFTVNNPVQSEQEFLEYLKYRLTITAKARFSGS